MHVEPLERLAWVRILPTTNADPGFEVRSANDLLNPTDNLVFAADYLKRK